MVSLLDIGPLTEEVEIRGTKITVQGLTAGHIFQLFSEFPDMRKMFETNTDMNPQSVMFQLAPDLIARIISTATGSPGDPAVEAKAKTMGAADQLAIISAVQRLSFKDGIGPFIDQISSLMGAAMPMPRNLEEKVTRTYNDTVKKLRSQSNASLQTDTPNLARGTVLHGSSKHGAN
jgi:hypothetical protein